MKLTLQQWNERTFARPRTRDTIYRMIAKGLIYPAPTKIGKEYEFDESAKCIDPTKPYKPNSLLTRINNNGKTQGLSQKRLTP